ncbi:MAG: hypothetical protein PHV66_10655, partial [Bacteroidales bacterium]|nr:hypothetical protein [Bacteroidales bacterium]
MKNLLVLTVALFVMASCSDDEVEKITFDSSVFGIEKIIVNNTTYSLKDSSFLIDKGADSPLYLTGSGYGPNYQELDYAFVSQTESLSSVAAILHERRSQCIRVANINNENLCVDPLCYFAQSQNDLQIFCSGKQKYGACRLIVTA